MVCATLPLAVTRCYHVSNDPSRDNKGPLRLVLIPMRWARPCWLSHHRSRYRRPCALVVNSHNHYRALRFARDSSELRSASGRIAPHGELLSRVDVFEGRTSAAAKALVPLDPRHEIALAEEQQKHDKR